MSRNANGLRCVSIGSITMPLLKILDIEMPAESAKDDSALSQTGSIVNILTFAIALAGAIWLWVSLAWKVLEELRAVKSTRGW